MTEPKSMKAWLYSTTTGGLEKNLTLNSSARIPGPLRQNELLIQVISASINPADYKVPEMAFGYALKAITTFPATPGMDFCGRVVKTNASGYEPGQLVFGCLGRPVQFGSLGEYLVADTNMISALPEGVEPDHAATVGVAGRTAYQSLAPYVSKGDRVLINGGSGGCGIYAIQIAKALGCHVTTTCSGKNVQFCKDLGADEVIDYTKEDVVGVLKELAKTSGAFGHVLDHIGSPANLYKESDGFLLPGKTFVQVGASGIGTFANRLVWPSFLGGGKRKYHIFFMKNEQKDFGVLGEWIQQGKIKVLVDSTFAFGDAVQAFEKLRSGRSRGKIIIHVESE